MPTKVLSERVEILGGNVAWTSLTGGVCEMEGDRKPEALRSAQRQAVW